MVPYLLRDVTAHQLLPRFVGMQPVAQIAPATGRLLKLFGDTTVGVTVYQLHGKCPANSRKMAIFCRFSALCSGLPV